MVGWYVDCIKIISYMRRQLMKCADVVERNFRESLCYFHFWLLHVGVWLLLVLHTGMILYKTCQFFFWMLRKNILKFHSAGCAVMCDACTMYAQGLHNTCTMHAQCVHNACTTHAQRMHYACTMHAQCMHNACRTHAQCMHNACRTHAQCMHNACTTLAQRIHNARAMHA